MLKLPAGPDRAWTLNAFGAFEIKILLICSKPEQLFQDTFTFTFLLHCILCRAVLAMSEMSVCQTFLSMCTN